MVEIEVLIDFIKGARRKGFRDDAIKKSLLDKGYSQDAIDDAFSNAGNPKRANFRTRIKKETDESKISMTILLDDWMKKAIDKQAEKDGLTSYNEVKKMIVNDIPPLEIPKRVVKAKIIRRKMTEEEKAKHRIDDNKYKEKVRKERGQITKAKRKGLFGDWKKEVESQE